MQYTENELRAMCRGFEDVLLGTSCHYDDAGNVLKDDLRGHALFSQSADSIKTACADFLDNIPEHIGQLLRECYGNRMGPWAAFEYIGADFLFVRNGHGVGFWDREFVPELIGEAMTDYCGAWNECYAYLGDDGLVYTDCVASRAVVFTVEWPTADELESI